MHLSLAWRTGLAVYVLAVASVDGRIRFFDLEKLSQLGELDLLNAICTCMTSFNIKDLAGRGGGGERETIGSPDHDVDIQGIFAWGDDKGDLHLMTQNTVINACRRANSLPSPPPHPHPPPPLFSREIDGHCLVSHDPKYCHQCLQASDIPHTQNPKP
jgi:hypothetical protein